MYWHGLRKEVQFGKVPHWSAHMILKVTRLGHPVLRQKAQSLSPEEITSAQTKGFLEDLFETMHEYDGIGIAAPQVHVSLAVAILGVGSSPRYPHAPEVPETVLINPKIKPLSKKIVTDWEGCLSVEGFRGQVPRWHSIEVESYNPKGEKVRFRADGFYARVIQHECDHLQGKVYLDRMKNLLTLTHSKEFDRYWSDEA